MELANINISLSISEEGMKTLGRAIAEGLINASSTADGIAKNFVAQLLKKAAASINTVQTNDDNAIVERTVRPNKNSVEPKVIDIIRTPDVTQVVTKSTSACHNNGKSGAHRTFVSDGTYTSTSNKVVTRTYTTNDNDSTTPLSGKKQHHRSVSGYRKGSYTRITPGSNIIRMRRKKGNRLNGPMLIDREFAADLMERNLTHVRIDTNNGMCLKFTREDVPTYSPKRNKTISRLRVHALNQQSGVPATYCINGGEFQKTIMKTLNTFVEPGGEALFRFKVIYDRHDECVIRMENYL